MRKQHPYAGHFIASFDCLFRLHTSVNGRFRISTVGEWHPDIPPNVGERRYKHPPREIGVDRLYETMVFPLGADGEPVSWEGIDHRSYNTAAEAEAGHEELVSKWEAAP
jgi:hypothetical protein